MTNSAAELEIRRQIIESHAVDVMVSISSNFFYTVTLPCTLWFFDKSKGGSKRANQVLLIDARHIYQQVDRAHREFTPQQIEFLSNIARLYRGEASIQGGMSGLQIGRRMHLTSRNGWENLTRN